MEYFLGIRPHSCIFIVFQRQQTLKKGRAEALATFSRQHGRQVVNTDDGERFATVGYFDVDHRTREGRVDRVDRDGIVRICSVARDIGDNGQLSFSDILDIFEGDEHRTWFRQVDTVDEDVSYKLD